MGNRVDAVVLSHGIVFVLEFKVGATAYLPHDLDQALDYALDLKNFHSSSHHLPIIPVLVATNAPNATNNLTWYEDRVATPVRCNAQTIGRVIASFANGVFPDIDYQTWLNAAYKPTPTIVEAAKALYEGHSVKAISRSDAGAINLSLTASAISSLIDEAKSENLKTAVFVTGVPGSGKTLAGLNLATSRMQSHEEEHAVFLSGNGPLVIVLREALARDEVTRARAEGRSLTKKDAERKAHSFIQNIHHFRDDALTSNEPPRTKIRGSARIAIEARQLVPMS